eukprot:1006811-Pelagomonas_calceolata.AAC.1
MDCNGFTMKLVQSRTTQSLLKPKKADLRVCMFKKVRLHHDDRYKRTWECVHLKVSKRMLSTLLFILGVTGRRNVVIPSSLLNVEIVDAKAKLGHTAQYMFRQIYWQIQLQACLKGKKGLSQDV